MGIVDDAVEDAPDFNMMDLFIVRLAFAVIFGLIVGLERELRGKPAGVKTFVTLCVGSCLLGQISSLSSWDPMRLAVGVVTGVGFLGAGALLKDERQGIVEGLTTAAVIWTASAISMAIGLGFVTFAIDAAIVVGVVVAFSHQISCVVSRLKGSVNHDDGR